VRPEQPELIARLIHEETARFYAAPQYLAKAGRPEDVRDLSSHDFISFGDAEGMVGHLTPLGFPLTKRNFRYESQSGLVAWELVKRGFGIAPMSDRIARQTPEVERLLPQMEPIRFPVWLTTHRELHTSRKIRLVFDLLAEHFFQK
jgi:DNA-binding transcriptional LysR family regulator